MESLHDRFALFLQSARARNVKQLQFSLLIAVLIALLLWRTQWLSLRPGLLMLLGGQLALAIAFFYRMSLKVVPAQSRNEMFAWFQSEENFIRFSAWAESLMRIIGFAVLAYGFWTATHFLGITLLLGVVYPIISYFGVAKRNTRQVLKRLQQQKQELR